MEPSSRFSDCVCCGILHNHLITHFILPKCAFPSREFPRLLEDVSCILDYICTCSMVERFPTLYLNFLGQIIGGVRSNLASKIPNLSIGSLSPDFGKKFVLRQDRFFVTNYNHITIRIMDSDERTNGSSRRLRNVTKQ